MRWFFVAWREVTRVFYNCLYKIEFEGLEHIPTQNGYIIACNHLHYFDPILLSFRIAPVIHYLGKKELFENRWVGWIFRGLGSFPVDRGTGDNGPIETCVNCLNAGGLLGIFPEGTRSRDGKPGRPKSGMALIAKTAKAPILPCAVLSDFPLRFRGKLVIRYGALIPYDQLGLEEDSPRALKRATKLVWGEILKMAVEETPDEND